MAGTGNSKTLARAEGGTADPKDPVLVELHQAEEQYIALRASWEERSAALAEAEKKIRSMTAAATRQSHKLKTLKAELEQEQERTGRYKLRADQMADHLKHIHQAIFDGNIYTLILKACITITGATRGLYITTVADDPTNLRIRAAVDVGGYPRAGASEFIQALCRKVLEEDVTFVCNHVGDDEGLPRPAREAEMFTNYVVAPVALLKHLSGIVIVADKMNGDFDEDDVNTLLSVGDQAAVAVENVRLQRELQHSYLATVSMLADAVEAKDPYTHGHCDLVSKYARMTAEKLKLAERDRSIVCYAALLHDVGKIAVSDGVLNKPGPLLPEERELMMSHVRVGHDLICRVPIFKSVAQVVLHHHEWYDGSGYPEGLKGEAIPIAARIVCVVDAYCAMITKRSYKDAYSDERARAELIRCSGTQFDPEVVEAFLSVLDSPMEVGWDSDTSQDCGMISIIEHIRGRHLLPS